MDTGLFGTKGLQKIPQLLRKISSFYEGRRSELTPALLGLKGHQVREVSEHERNKSGTVSHKLWTLLEGDVRL